ncbi:MAG TPA: hypothetical protein VIO64_01340 [Pseudobacteroides sp.]|uniref:hypothetical protein n=1 Tax=Pseudobacteroides sp. TaxID=1968840 RepID=UPI002F93A2E5
MKRNMLKISTAIFWVIVTLVLVTSILSCFLNIGQTLVTKGTFHKNENEYFYIFDHLEKGKKILNIGDQLTLKSDFMDKPIQGKVTEISNKDIYVEDGVIVNYKIQISDSPQKYIDNLYEVKLILNDKINLLKMMLSKFVEI